jgi:ubiquinone/menaquinone biosynthesis C-methylase UbiE
LGEAAGDHKERVRAQFGATARGYVSSAGHAAGEDLEQLVAWAEGGPDRAALDVATGGGHLALALARRYGRVVATDLASEMLGEAEAFIQGRGAANVEFRVADAERLPFEDESFDAVSCRIAPHHFGDVWRFVREAARVLGPGGLLLLEDSVTPEDPALGELINRVDALRDPTHVRSLAASEWRRLLADAGLRIEAELEFPKRHELEGWLARARASDAARSKVMATLLDAPPEARAAFAIETDAEGAVVAFTDRKLALKARKLTA